MKLRSYVQGRWHEAAGGFVEVPSAIDGRTVALVSSDGVDFDGVLRYARGIGGPNLRALTFHERAEKIKQLALYLNERKERLYELSYDTGGTRKDNWVDIDGGIMTLFSFASKGKRELPNARVATEGALEALSKGGTFVGRHVMTPLLGAAVFIDAYNFPCWGMLEKLAPAFIAGVPCIVKPATPSAYVTHAMVEDIIASGILPEGALQLICGSLGDLLERLSVQDVVSFTGSATTSLKLRQTPAILRNSVRFIAEQDSLNASILGDDVQESDPEFELFVKEVAREITTKAGQRCTCIRRAIVPRRLIDAVQKAIVARLERVKIGDPRASGVTMGALVSRAQRDDVRARVAQLATEATIVYGDPREPLAVDGVDPQAGAFMNPVLLRCEQPLSARLVHEVEAFGPVTTLLPYDTVADAVRIANLGEGSLCASIFSYDALVADALVLGIAAFHGRVLVVDRDNAKEQTGHGTPLAPLIHGGPGRAGGGEEMGGVRGIYHYMQRTAVEGTPERLATVTGIWNPGANEKNAGRHPFEACYEDLRIGETFYTPAREITLADIEHFAEFTGDGFYAHMDEAAAKASPFFDGRVAHGYLLLSFAAGLFVRPQLGPVLANYGLESLRFVQPVYPGDSMRVRLTVKEKRPRKPEYGEVRWSVTLFNQDDEVCATYDLLTMNATRAHVPTLEPAPVA
jgi:oxepin-CoA hydrolase/3-oxo-5,6-dehydrosuberyl-CoA semialdehyde dehydrogenase